MTASPLSASGIIGTAGRVLNPSEPPQVRTADLRLAGDRLPVVSPVRVYVCGITPYDVTHLGHAATFVWADVLGSVLRMVGADVVTSRNVTDVDDVLTRAADARGRQYAFDQDMRALGVRRPTHEPRARQHVGHVQQLAAALLVSGRAYEREGHVFFRGGAVAETAGLDRAHALHLAAEYGDEPDDPLREDPFDVAVWRPSGENDPAWPSPWGWGRPGWHAECAAMAWATLGQGIDLLVGGADLAFPHHAYQTALVEAASEVIPFARRHFHVGAVRRDGEKMAKSTGNLVLVADLLREHPPAAVRGLLLDRHWAADWDYNPALLDSAASRLDALYSAAARPVSAPSAVRTVADRLLDNLDVPGALDVAIEAGGDAARLLTRVLSLG